MDTIVEIKNICKKYGQTQALADVSFSIYKGEIFGLIGPDGAGKSTLFHILTTLLLPDSGTASVLGLDTKREYTQIRSYVGYMPGKFSLYQDLTVEENLKFFATVFNTTVEENYANIKDIYTQLAPFKSRRAGALSGGMKQKLALCCTLIHAPEILFLDEPTTGVDPVSRQEFWQILAHLRNKGITIIVSTPFMDEALQCDRIAFLYEGTIKGIDQPPVILKRFSDILCPSRLERKATGLMNEPIIKVENLVKKFGNFSAVDHISFQVKKAKYSDFSERTEQAKPLQCVFSPV